MRYVGTFGQRGILYYFLYSFNNNSISWILYKSNIENEGTIEALMLEDVIKHPKKIDKKFVEGSIVITSKEMMYYGNSYLINLLIDTFNKKDTLKKEDLKLYNENETETVKTYEKVTDKITIKKKERIFKTVYIPKGNESEEKTIIREMLNDLEIITPDINLKLLNCDPDGSRITLKLDYQQFDINTSAIRNSKDLISSTKAKSLSFLRITRDLSFYFNNDGTTKKRYRIVNNLFMLKQILENEVKDKVKIWAVDIESTGLMMYKPNEFNADQMDKVVSIMFSWKKDEAIFIPIDMVYMKNIESGWEKILKPYLETIPAVGANISFDARALYSYYDIEVNVQHDVLQLAYVINCYAVKNHNNLKEHEHNYLNVDTLTLKDIFGTAKLAGLFRYLPEELALIYACPDVDMCLQLLEILLKKLPKSCEKSYMLDMATIRNLYKLDAVGNAIDVELAQKYREANNKDKEVIKNLIFKIVGQQLALINKVAELKGKYDIENNKKDEQLVFNELMEFIKSPAYKTAKKEFNIASDELGKHMYETLKYPVFAIQEKTKKPAVNAPVLKKLMEEEFTSTEEMQNASITGSSEGYLKEDIMSAISDFSVEPEVLINAKKFNKMKYPLAYLIVEYRLREKRDNTFYHQIIDQNVGGLYYTSTKSAHAETARLINVIQVLQSYMKKLVIPYNKDYYMLVFDFSQIEYRVMTGLSKFLALKKRLDSPRADFHKEGGAILLNKAPYLISSDERRNLKQLNFAIPYGFGLRQLCVALYKEVNEVNMLKTTALYSSWKSQFAPIWNLLEEGRDKAMEKGYVESVTHRRRPFIKEYPFDSIEEEQNAVENWKADMSNAKRSMIRRESGNFLIQETAAHIFKVAFNNFRNKLKEEGLDKLVLTTALIHDEMVSSVHKSVNPYYLYKLIYNEVMLVIKGHPRYYAGISVVDNWYEGKADEFEAPIEFVEHIIKSDKSKDKFLPENHNIDIKNMVFNDIKAFMQNLLKSEYEKCGIDFNSDTLNIDNLLKVNKDYFILDKVGVYWPMKKAFKKLLTKSENSYDNTKFIRSFERFALELGIRKEYNIIYPEDYPLRVYGKITDTKREFFDEDGNLIFTQDIEVKEDVNVEVEPKIEVSLENIDLENLTFDSEEELDKDLSSIEELELFEEFDVNTNDNSAVYYFNNKNTVKPDEDILYNPDKYISTNVSASSERAVTFSKNEIIINDNRLKAKGSKEIIDYFKQYESNRLGSVPIYIKSGNTTTKLDFKVKGYDIEKVNDLSKQYELKRI